MNVYVVDTTCLQPHGKVTFQYLHGEAFNIKQEITNLKPRTDSFHFILSEYWARIGFQTIYDVIPHSAAQTSRCREEEEEVTVKVSVVSWLLLAELVSLQSSRSAERSRAEQKDDLSASCFLPSLPRPSLSLAPSLRSCSHQSLCLHCNGRLSVCGEWRLKFYNFNLPVPAPDSLSLFIKHMHASWGLFFSSSSLHLYLVLMAASCRAVHCQLVSHRRVLSLL